MQEEFHLSFLTNGMEVGTVYILQQRKIEF